MEQRVVIGLSGGVDSSVAAYLLKKQGYDVIALFMRNWNDESVIIDDECPWIEDSQDALMVAEQLGIPFQTIDLSEQYKARIVNYMFKEYERGRTPNPDVLCNREIKYDVFLKHALLLGASYVATGHYCRKSTFEKNGKIYHQLLAGKDTNKDQSYFLCQLNQEQLAKAMFPIGSLTKPEVRKIAKELGLTTAKKRDSQGLCFVGKVKLPDFLKQKLKPKEGDIVEIPNTFNKYDVNVLVENLNDYTKAHQYNSKDGKIVGKHNGAHYFTVGQRKGLAVGGTKQPLYVIATDTIENIVYVGKGDKHKGLYRDGLFIPNKDIHWVREDLQLNTNDSRDYLVRIRYRQPLSIAKLIKKEDGLYFIFMNPQRGVAPGQFAVWYNQEEELIGSGVIA